MVIRELDIKGAIYEGLLENTASSSDKGAGQYFTPRPLIRAIVEVMQPAPGQVIGDPACGTGGFLLAAHDFISAHHKLDKAQRKHLSTAALRGNDIVPAVVSLCAMNLYLHGIGTASNGDSFAWSELSSKVAEASRHSYSPISQRRDASATFVHTRAHQVHDRHTLVSLGTPLTKRTQKAILSRS